MEIPILSQLGDAMCHKHLQKWESAKWQIHHDKAPAHSAQLVGNC
jgi:hypothetical protein